MSSPLGQPQSGTRWDLKYHQYEFVNQLYGYILYCSLPSKSTNIIGRVFLSSTGDQILICHWHQNLNRIWESFHAMVKIMKTLPKWASTCDNRHTGVNSGEKEERISKFLQLTPHTATAPLSPSKGTTTTIYYLACGTHCVLLWMYMYTFCTYRLIY